VKDRKNILLVEDEFLIAMGKQKELENYGYTVQHVNTGEKAVTFANGNIEIDLILMDIDLGKGIDGTEAATLILKDNDIPIVFLSSLSDPDIVKKTEKIASYGYVFKSSGITVLDVSVKMAFKLFEANKTIIAKEKMLFSIADNYPNSYISIIESDYSIGFTAGQEFKKQNLDPNQFVGLQLAQVFEDPDQRMIIRDFYDKTFKGEECLFELFINEQYQRYRTVPLYTKKGNIDQILSVAENITERKRTEEELKEIANKITERVKELNCLYKIAELVEDANNSLDDIYEGIANLIPPSWQYPDSTCTKIMINEKEFISSNYKATEWQQSADIIVYGKKCGSIIVGYLDGYTFLKEEQMLLDSICERLGRITERKQAEEEIKKQLLEKEIILKETHHRIKNNFTSIEGILSLQVDSSDNSEVHSALNIAIGRIKGYSVLYDKLLLSDNYQTTSVKEYLNNLVNDIIDLLSNKQNLTIETQYDDIQLDSKRLFPIGLIVNELLTNVMKYAFTNRDSGIIKITLKKDGKEITLTIEDNGNGLPDSFDRNKTKGFGLTLIQMLSEQLDGSFTIENHLGTTSVIKLPI
jgi:two-component sensor histidine kinase/CheY-like chemotaxis protein